MASHTFENRSEVKLYLKEKESLSLSFVLSQVTFAELREGDSVRGQTHHYHGLVP